MATTKRLKITCVARAAAKANFLTTVTGGVTVKQVRAHASRHPSAPTFLLLPAARPRPLRPLRPPGASDRDVADQARGEIQKIFEKVSGSEVNMVSCVQPPDSLSLSLSLARGAH